MHKHSKLFIDGAWQTPSGQGFAEVINPATEQVAGCVPLGNEADVERAVAAARKAFPAWSATSSGVRASYIRALAEQLAARAEDMSAVITAELAACQCNGAVRCRWKGRFSVCSSTVIWLCKWMRYAKSATH